MKLGVKTYLDENYIEHFAKKVDFIEVMGISPENFLKNKKIEVHCQHERFGVNLADKTKEKENLKAIKSAIEIAEFSNAEKIIVHPGRIENENCSETCSIEIIKKINDSRITIENMPKFYGDKKFLCATPDEIKKYLEKTKANFCFDINHAISTAVTENLDPYTYIEDFIKLKPQHIHLGGQKLPEDITHISFTESNIDLQRVLKNLPKNSEVTLEVTQDIQKTEEDIKRFKDVWKETY